LRRSLAPNCSNAELSHMAQQQFDTLKFSDGTTMDLTRLPEIDAATWSGVRGYLESNPAVAKNLQNISKDADGIRSWLQSQAVADHYQGKPGEKNNQLEAKMKALASSDPELAPILKKIKKDGLGAALKACGDEKLLKKLSQKMGGIPPELVNALNKLDMTSLTLHEACKNGDFNAVKSYMGKQRPIDEKDHKGITSLGYAIGANQTGIVQLLLENNANPHSVDNNESSGLHFAAGYGRVELVELLVKARANLHKTNGQGQTPLALATWGKHAAVIQILQQHGAVA